MRIERAPISNAGALIPPNEFRMPWPTTDGLRTLRGAEADLVRGAIGMMVDALVAEVRMDTAAAVPESEDDQWRYGIDWFDQWDARQRLWLLENVTRAFFSDHVIQSPAAMFDAAADAIFFELIDLVQIEVEQGSATDFPRSWRESVLAAFETQTSRTASMAPDSTDLSRWSELVSTIGDRILGVRVYRKAEAFRDGDLDQTNAFLRDRGLPQDYLSRIPPLRSTERVQLSIDRIQAIVFQDDR